MQADKANRLHLPPSAEPGPTHLSAMELVLAAGGFWLLSGSGRELINIGRGNVLRFSVVPSQRSARKWEVVARQATEGRVVYFEGSEEACLGVLRNLGGLLGCFVLQVPDEANPNEAAQGT